VSNSPHLLVIQNDESDPPHLAGRWLIELGFTVQIIRAYLGEPVPLHVPDGIAALMPLGGHMGATDDQIAPWLPAERALLADALQREIPIFAICLGSQLLAIAGGGAVTRAATGEIGIYQISPTRAAADDSVFDIPAGTAVTQWHEDEVSALPEGAICLASSEQCNNQIYRIGELAYGVQFHPEADLSIVAKWEAQPDNAFTTLGKSSVLAEVEAAAHDLAIFWKPIIQRWGALVLARDVG
jgi:GMP synthase (glutamine-hydrolysing)